MSTEINLEEILNKYLDGDRTKYSIIKSMQQACEQTKQACIEEAKGTTETFDFHKIYQERIENNVIIK